jgi:hypothetical protein
MRRSIGDRLRRSIRAAVRELGASASPTSVEARIRERDPALFGDWRVAVPEPAARAAFLVQVLAPARPRRAVPARPEAEWFLWPIGSRQRWNLLASRGNPGPTPDPTESRFYLHNYGTSDALEVVVTIAGLWQEFIPRIAADETVEVEWSEERIHPSDAEVPPAEERGYPDPFNPSGDRLEGRADLRVEFTARGRRRLLEGILYFWPGSPPSFFQRTGAPDAPDHARQIR